MLRNLLLALLLLPLGLLAQRTIKWKGMQLNNLDKQGQKQGEWLFFDKEGNVLMQCSFKDDALVGPRVFFDHGDTSLIRFQPVDSLEHFIYYYHGKTLSGVFVNVADKFRIELEKIPEGFSTEDITAIQRQYALKIEPVYMFGTQTIVEYFSAACYKSNTIPNWNHNFVVTINASGKVTHVEREQQEELWTANAERELYDMLYSMGRWQPFFDTWKASEIKVKVSLMADFQTITAR